MAYKDQKTIQKALRLFLDGMPVYKIAKELHIWQRTVYTWRDKYGWEEKRHDSIQKRQKTITEGIIAKQERITELANEELLNRLERQKATSDQVQIVLREILRQRADGEITKSEMMTFLKQLETLGGTMIHTKDLINIMKHGLEVVRPKTISQYNFMKQDNNSTQINIKIPDEIRKLVEQED